jgi:hypothetical protein
VNDRHAAVSASRPLTPSAFAFSSEPPAAGGGGYAAPPPPPPPPAGPPTGYEPPVGGEPPAAASGLPWENRAQVGFGPGLLQSAQRFATRPRQAFDSARRKGDYGSPLLWIVIFGAIAGLIQWLYSMMFLGPTMAMMPPELRDQLGPLIGSGAMAGGALNIIYYPCLAVIGAFITSAILHLCFMIAGGSSRSESGFEGTFRATSYTQLSSIAQIVPILGGLITIVWSLVLLVIGMSSMHRISTGKAVIVVLIPAFLCCACVSIAIALGAASLIGLSNR